MGYTYNYAQNGGWLMSIPNYIDGFAGGVGFLYDKNGFLKGIGYHDGKQATITPDSRYRVGSIVDTAGLNITYTYDPQGNVQTINGHLQEYDQLGRLRTARIPLPGGGYSFTEYGYDKAGNRNWQFDGEERYYYCNPSLPGNVITEVYNLDVASDEYLNRFIEEVDYH